MGWEQFPAFLAGFSFLGMPWVAWAIVSRRKHKLALKKLEAERERELTRRRYMELDYELRQRQITEKLFDQTADEIGDGHRGPPQPRRQVPPGTQRPAG